MKRRELVEKLEAAMHDRYKKAEGTRGWYLAGLEIGKCQANLEIMRHIVETELISEQVAAPDELLPDIRYTTNEMAVHFHSADRAEMGEECIDLVAYDVPSYRFH